ncbi:MAG: cobalamin-independent methionine synthase II family protein [Myxococcota bacterium]
MERSDSRILSTHAGSLPRPDALNALLVRRSRSEAVDPGELARLAREATERVVARQLEVGIDVGNDGEQARGSFFTHVAERMTGFGGASQRPLMRDLAAYPSFVRLKAPEFARDMVSLMRAPQAIGPVKSLGPDACAAECAALAEIVARQPRSFAECFMTAPSPGIVAAALGNAHYATLGEYVDAVADALRPEYEQIASRGFVLQIDAPDLAMERHTLFADRPLAEFLGFVSHVVDATNRALANVPRERVRLHVCWGNYEGPHTHDVDLAPLLPHVYRARVGGLVLSMANPRHAHEHRVLREHPLPRDWNLVVGAIDTTTNYVEHPEVVAERIERAASAVGDPRRVLAGTDCGFATAAGLGEVAEEIVWEKLRALSAGAALASKRLFGQSSLTR